MNRPLLADAIHAADALLEPHGVPGQLEVDDEAAALLQVQAFAGGVGGEQHARAPAGERADGVGPLEAVHAAVQDGRIRAGLRAQRFERVAKLGEDDDGLVDAREDPPECAPLGVVRRGERRTVEQRRQHAPLLALIVEPWCGQHGLRRRVGFVILRPRQGQLSGGCVRRRAKPIQARGERAAQRFHAGERALEKHRHRQARGAVVDAPSARPDGPDVLVEALAHRTLRGSRLDPVQMNAPSAGDAGLLACSPEHDERVVLVQRADAAQRQKRPRVTAVRRRGQQQHQARARREGVRGGAALAVAGREVRLVDDHGIPAEVLHAAPHVGALGEVERRHVYARSGPGVGTGRQDRPERAEPAGVRHRGVEPEAGREFDAPLIAEPRRRQHERAVEHRALAKFGQHEARLDRLAEAHRIGEQHSPRAVADEGERGLELMRQEICVGAGGSGQAARLTTAEACRSEGGHPGTA